MPKMTSGPAQAWYPGMTTVSKEGRPWCLALWISY